MIESLHTDLRVVAYRFWCGEQDELRVVPCYFVRNADQLFSDSFVLEGGVNGKIGQIAAEGEVSDCPRHTDQAIVCPGGYDDVGVVEHLLNSRTVCYGSAFGQS